MTEVLLGGCFLLAVVQATGPAAVGCAGGPTWHAHSLCLQTSRDVEELTRFLDESVEAGTEGLIVKTVDGAHLCMGRMAALVGMCTMCGGADRQDRGWCE